MKNLFDFTFVKKIKKKKSQNHNTAFNKGYQRLTRSKQLNVHCGYLKTVMITNVYCKRCKMPMFHRQFNISFFILKFSIVNLAAFQTK